jgi:uncharacterized protein (DUF58 family)
MEQSAEIVDLLDTDAIARTGHLELLSTRVVDGFLSGKHRSTHKGGCFEFAEHRAYAAGDEVRLIDWHVFAKSDRYYVKLFEEETNLQALMVVDVSGSMQFGASTVTKAGYAKMACACLSRLMLRQRDAVGLALFDEKVRQYIPPRSQAVHLSSMLDALRRGQPGGTTSLAGTLHEVAKRMKRRGLIIIFSDCFGDLPSLTRALHHLRLRGHEVLLFHVMAPEEITFSFNKWSRFQCLEVDGLRMNVDPPAVRKAYLASLRGFLDRLKRDCARMGCDLQPMSTAEPLGEVLAHYLTRRNARVKA